MLDISSGFLYCNFDYLKFLFSVLHWMCEIKRKCPVKFEIDWANTESYLKFSFTRRKSLNWNISEHFDCIRSLVKINNKYFFSQMKHFPGRLKQNANFNRLNLLRVSNFWFILNVRNNFNFFVHKVREEIINVNSLFPFLKFTVAKICLSNKEKTVWNDECRAHTKFKQYFVCLVA